MRERCFRDCASLDTAPSRTRDFLGSGLVRGPGQVAEHGA